MHILIPEEETHQRFAAREAEQFPSVAEDDGLAGRGIVGIEMAFRKPVHVRMDAFTRRDGGDDLAVAVEVDPHRPVHGAGVLLPGESVGKTDGGEPDVPAGRDGGGSGGVPGRPGIINLVTGHTREKQVAGAGRQGGGKKEDSEFPHGFFAAKIGTRNKKQHKGKSVCVVSVCFLMILIVSGRTSGPLRSPGAAVGWSSGTGAGRSRSSSGGWGRSRYPGTG